MINCPEDYGALGDGVADDSAAFALAVAEARWLMLTPGKHYRTKGVSLPPHYRITGRGATIEVLPGAAIGNTLFHMGHNTTAEVELTQAVRGDTQIQTLRLDGYSEVTAFVHAGDYQGVNNEWGPGDVYKLTFSHSDATHSYWDTQQPIRLNYTGSEYQPKNSIPPRLQVIPSDLGGVHLEDISFRCADTFNGVYFNGRYIFDLFVDRCRFEGAGSGVYTGKVMQGARIQGCRFRGNYNHTSGTLWNAGSCMQDCVFDGNAFAFNYKLGPSVNCHANEVFCYDNSWINNRWVNVQNIADSGGALNLGFNSGGNYVAGNIFEGLLGTQHYTNYATAIRDYGNSMASVPRRGNHYANNTFRNLYAAIRTNSTMSTLIGNRTTNVVQPFPWNWPGGPSVVGNVHD